MPGSMHVCTKSWSDIVQVIFKEGYVEDHLISNVKITLGALA